MYNTDKYILIPIFIPAVKDGINILCRIYREVYLVDNLKAYMLLGNNIIGSKKMVLDISQGKAYIGSYNTTAGIISRQRGPYQRRVIHARKALTVAPRTNIIVPIAILKALPDRDYIFEPVQQKDLTLYIYLVDSYIAGVLVKNKTDKPIYIPKRLRLGILCEVDYKNVFFTTSDDDTPNDSGNDGLLKALLPKPSISKPKKPATTNWIKKAAILATVASINITSSLLHLVYNATTTTDLAKETKLPNGIMVYSNRHDTQLLSNLVDEFPTVWRDEGFVNVPEDRWMKITLRDDWQNRLPTTNKSSKVYPLGIQERQVVDDTFDKIQEQGRLEYTAQPTPFSYPVFVVWRNIPDGSRKGRAVVDIRGLNDLILPDVYPVPLQGDVIARLLGCTHIAVIDAILFFY